MVNAYGEIFLGAYRLPPIWNSFLVNAYVVGLPPPVDQPRPVAIPPLKSKIVVGGVGGVGGEGGGDGGDGGEGGVLGGVTGEHAHPHLRFV